MPVAGFYHWITNLLFVVICSAFPMVNIFLATRQPLPIFVIDYDGQMESENLILAEIKATVCHFLPEAEVVLFGSRARGDNQFNSDYDLLVIVKKSFDNQQRLHFQAVVRKALADQNILADIILHSANEIEKKMQLPGHIVRTAMREGVTV